MSRRHVFVSLTRLLVALEGDLLARELFTRAGRHLGRHVLAVVRDEHVEVSACCEHV